MYCASTTCFCSQGDYAQPLYHCRTLLTGALAALLDGKLVLLDSAAGSLKLDSICSLDLMCLTNSYNFATKMKTDSVTLLEGLESWVDKQSHSMDAAQNLEKLSGNFDSLLKVMDSLYQVTSCGCLC
eukprot:GHUV01049147.1.p1 GENE.GHUV01049147.1~~GHUV01049147.1.p1  ORF type:complete len:127 (-),score=42.34 GHUV01049147.1:374-754(-)